MSLGSCWASLYVWTTALKSFEMIPWSTISSLTGKYGFTNMGTLLSLPFMSNIMSHLLDDKIRLSVSLEFRHTFGWDWDERQYVNEIITFSTRLLFFCRQVTMCLPLIVRFLARKWTWNCTSAAATAFVEGKQVRCEEVCSRLQWEVSDQFQRVLASLWTLYEVFATCNSLSKIKEITTGG